jgi:2-polyprenyl-6-methoxyphenol hydroxylase-like FAD-dependent oxidoreductase
MESVNVCVRGTGPVGMSLALALARQGLRVAVVGPSGSPSQAPDVRAYALNAASRELLLTLKVWDALPADAVTPVYDMHVRGDAGGSALDFSAWSQATAALAWIVDAAELESALHGALRCSAHVLATDQAVDAELTVLAEGKDSASRAALGVHFDRHAYGQTALAARLVAETPHAGVARQWFRSPDVLALLPLDRPAPGQSYALVWSLPHDRAATLLKQSPSDFESALNTATQDGRDALGALRLASEIAAWPLAIAHADRTFGPGWIVIGDAAHQVHPLAGQGLNLGLADAAALARVVAARETWRTLGDEKLLARVERERTLPTRAMAQLTDGLLELFARPEPWVRELRNRGMTLLNHLPPLKRMLVARALDA